MEELLTKLRSCSRFLELEDSIPYWEARIPELEDRIEEMKWNLQQKKLELLQLQNANFFQRLFGRAEEKKEKLSRQIREITAAQTAAQWELEGLKKQVEDGKQELTALAGSREAYQAAKAEAVLSPAQDSRLVMEQISAFAPVALETAWHVLEALEAARPWMTTRITADNRKMECLGRAEAGAGRLCEVLAALPEGAADVGNYLKAPHAYIYGVTSEYRQLDRLELAQEQVRNVRSQLKLLLGE